MPTVFIYFFETELFQASKKKLEIKKMYAAHLTEIVENGKEGEWKESIRGVEALNGKGSRGGEGSGICEGWGSIE